MTTPIAEVMPYSAIFEKELNVSTPRIVAGLANVSAGNTLRLKLPKGANTLQLATQYAGNVDVFFSDGTPGAKIIKSYPNGGGGVFKVGTKNADSFIFLAAPGAPTGAIISITIIPIPAPD